MFLSRFLFSRTPVLAGLVAAGLLWAAQPVSAQQPYAGVSKFDRANAGAALPGAYYAPWYAPKEAASPPHPAAVVVTHPMIGPLVVTVTGPAQTEPVYVTLRGPDGAVQHYALENGPESIQTRTVIVHQGETASFRFAVAASPK